MARLDQWSEERRFGPISFGKDEEFRKLANERAENRKGEFPGLTWTLIASSRELIFEMRDGEPVFHYVLIGIDSRTLELVTTPAIEANGDVNRQADETIARRRAATCERVADIEREL